MRTITNTTLCLLALAACPWYASAQSYDSSGNSVLNGTYYVRQVMYFIESAGDVNGSCVAAGSCDAISTYGTITFDGAGSYTFSGWYLDAGSGSATPVQFTSNGTYVISASGEGYMTEFNNQVGLDTGDQIVGLVSHGSPGIFIGSSTETAEGLNDVVIAAPVGSTAATNATLNGTYQVAYFDPTYYPSNAAVSGGDALFSMTANGSGNIGTVNVNGYVGTNSASSETLTGVTYSFMNGAANVSFGGNPNNELIAGTELLYISPDGSFVFGGSANGFDIFAGVRAATTNPSTYNALYYQAGFDLDNNTASNNYVLFDSYYGSINIFGNQSGSSDSIGDQRLNYPLVYGGSADYTYYDNFSLNGDGSSDDGDFSQHYFSSPDGSIRIGSGNAAGHLSLNVALQAPSSATQNGSGVYLSPIGMVNAASNAPFTAHLSPGEFLTLYGSNLAPSDASAPSLPLPKSLNSVQVMINGTPAPLLFVSPTQINVVVPFFTTQAIAQIQVINGNTTSNTVTQFVGNTSVGVFTNPAGGIYDAAALDVTNGYSFVTASNGALAGDSIALYLAGLGAVNPSIQDGQAGPSNPLSNTIALPDVYLLDSSGNYQQATVGFAGLAPGFAGLYQINFTVPSGLVSGYAGLEVEGYYSSTALDSDTFESILCISSCTSSGAVPAARALAAGHHGRIHTRRSAVRFKVDMSHLRSHQARSHQQ